MSETSSSMSDRSEHRSSMWLKSDPPAAAISFSSICRFSSTRDSVSPFSESNKSIDDMRMRPNGKILPNHYTLQQSHSFETAQPTRAPIIAHATSPAAKVAASKGCMLNCHVLCVRCSKSQVAKLGAPYTRIPHRSEIVGKSTPSLSQRGL